jgi:hypothetical protein
MPSAFSAAAASAAAAMAVAGLDTMLPNLSLDGRPSVNITTKFLPQDWGSG